MSDSDSASGSSSDESAASSHAAVSPQDGQHDVATGKIENEGNLNEENHPNAEDAASDTSSSSRPPPDPDGEPLHLLWEDEEEAQEDDAEEQDEEFIGQQARLIDFIIIPGVHSARSDGFWMGQGPGHAGPGHIVWVTKFAEKRSASEKNPRDSCRVFWYEYDSSEFFRGRRSRQSIHQMAMKLLRALRAKRRHETKRRQIYFISHDLGGIIVKDALVTAALNKSAWVDISEMARVLIFQSSPHRSFNEIDLTNKLTSFLYSNPNYSKFIPAATTVSGVSKAILEINRLFVDSKIPLRSWIINVTMDEQGPPSSRLGFGNYGSTLGLPLETRFSVPINSNYSTVIEHLNKLESDINQVLDPSQYREERTLLALASPVYPLTNAKGVNILSDLPEYQAWLDSPFPQILYIHGKHLARAVAEQVFYSLEDETEKVKRRAMVLYFSFNRWDVRCDSIRDMIATFLAQIANHHPKLGNDINAVFTQHRNERGWTETDLIQFFELFRTSDEVEQTMIVINHFDECTKGSRKRFLDKVIHMHESDEIPWKIVVTSQEPGALTDELAGSFCVPIDLSALELELITTGGIEGNVQEFMKIRPDLTLMEEQVREELGSVESLEPTLRQIIINQARVRREWPDEISIQDMFHQLDSLEDTTGDDDSLAAVLDLVLKRFPDQAMLRRLLTWLLYAVRPLTIWELTTVLSFGAANSREDILPSTSTIESLVSSIQERLAGIIAVNHNEVKFQHPRLHSIMVDRGDSEKASSEKGYYMWDEIKKTAHADISSLCLEYLSTVAVQEYITKTFDVTDAETFETPTFPDRENLVSYAIQAWPHHYSLSSPSPDLSGLTSQAGLVQTLAKAHWALANPATRSPMCPETLFPIFAGLGLRNVVKPLDDGDAFQGLLEALRKEQKEFVDDVLAEDNLTETELWQALEAVSSSGNEEMMLSLLSHIHDKSKIHKDFPWPPVLIYRGAWLGLDRFTEKILALGCPPDPDVEWRTTLLASPLFQAARHGHASTVRTLLKYGASMEFTALYNRNPLDVASVDGHVEVIKAILEESEVQIDRTSEQKFTAMYLAVVFGHQKVAKLLLDKGADPNMGIAPTDQNYDQWTPLVVAADDGFKECTKLLLERGANPNICGPDGPPLRWAVTNGHLEIFNMLLDAGADPRSELLKTPLLVEAVGWELEDVGIPMLERLLELDLDINAKDEDGDTALLAAAKSYPRETINNVLTYMPSPLKDLAVRMLLDHGADVNLRNDEGVTPLFYATTHWQYNLAKMLLEAGADPNQANSDGVSPLFNGLNVPGMARLLLEKGANPNFGTSNGWTPLTAAAHFGYHHAVMPLLEHGASVDLEYGVGVEEPGLEWRRGWTPLMCAASNGYPGICVMLAEAGADLQHKTPGFEQPVLHLAAFGPTLPVILEFSSRVDVNQSDSEGWTAVHYRNLPLDNLRRLVNAGADIEFENNQGLTALNVFASFDLPKVQFLVKRGANINHMSPWFGSALHQACRAPVLEIIKFLIEKGADVNSICDSTSGTPLQSLCIKRGFMESPGHEEMVQYLFSGHEKQKPDVTLKAGLLGYAINAAAFGGSPGIIDLILDQEGATIEVRDDMGRMPIHFAALSGIPNFEAILDKGGDIHAKDNLGRTALHWAAQVGRLQVVEKIISLMDDKQAVDAPDIDGWTPLCWAARGTGSWLDPAHATEPSSGIEVTRLLLENGANRNVVVSLGDEKWSPHRIARFSRTNPDIVSMMANGISSDAEDGKDGIEEPPSTNDEQEVENMEESKTKLGIPQPGRCCDSCQCQIYGFVYICETCPWFSLCFRCYPHAAVLHSPKHTYNQEGGEEDEDDAMEDSPAASSSFSGLSSSSDSDSDTTNDEEN